MKKKNKKEKNKAIIYIKKCMPYFMEVKGSVIILILLSIFFSIVNPLFPAIIAKALDFTTSGKYTEAIISVILIVLVSIFSNLMNIQFRNSFVKIQNNVVNSIRKDVIHAYFMIRNKELIKTSSGLFLTRITSDPETIVGAFGAIRTNISTILSNLFVFIYIFYLHPILGIITIIGTYTVYKIEKISMDKWNAFRKEKNKLVDKNTTVINEGIKGVLDIKLLNITNFFEDKLNSNLNEISEKTITANNKDAKYMFLRDLTVDIFTCIVVVIAIIFAKKDIYTIKKICYNK